MTDKTVKKLLAFAVRNRKNLSNLLSCFNADDLEKGTLRIPERMLNFDLNELVIQKGSPYLNDYRITFQDGSIFLDVTGSAPQIGTLHALYRINVTHFAYQPGLHTVSFTYQEDVHSEGGFLQGMLMRAAGLSQATYLKLAVHLLKISGAVTGQDENGADLCTVDLEQIYPFDDSLLNRFHLEFHDARDGQLIFRFAYTDR